MKTRLGLIILLLMCFNLNAQAGMVESADNANSKKEVSWVPSSAGLEDIKAEAKKIVRKWTAFFEEKINQFTSGDQKNEGLAQKPNVNRSVASEDSSSSSTPVVNTAPAVSRVSASPEQKDFSDVLAEAKNQIQNKEVVREAQPARKGTSALPNSKSGVPVFQFSQTEFKTGKDGVKKKVNIPVTTIPRLDIGVEKVISKNDFVLNEKIVGFRVSKAPSALDTPKNYPQKSVDAIAKQKLPLVSAAKSPKQGDFEIGQIVTSQKIADVSLVMKETKALDQLKPFAAINPDAETMLAAVILFERGDKCHLVSGLLQGLADKKETQEEANFYLGVCADRMGFHSEAVTRLSQVIKGGNSEYISDAIQSLVEDLPAEYDNQAAKVLRPLVGSNLVPDAAKDNFHFVLARAAHDESKYDDLASFAKQVSDKSPLYAKAAFMHAIGLYATNQGKAAEENLKKLREYMLAKSVKDKNLDALIALNLARIAFMQKRYDVALQEYLKMPKDHPLWVQGLVEQGWAQLNVDDPEGAIGNMYSLHSPYFRFVYIPESWVVRTIGYISICQYGDAYKTLTRHEQMHANLLAQMNKYIKDHKDPLQYYNTVRSYIKGPSDKTVDGLSPPVIREIARQKGFLNIQSAMNNLEDELAQYGFIYNLVKKDNAEMIAKLKQTQARYIAVKLNLEKAKKDSQLLKNVNEWTAQKRQEEKLARYYTDILSLYEKSRKGFVEMRNRANGRIAQLKEKLKVSAGKELMAHLRDTRLDIEQMIEGNEFLRYEIFSGSGENIRYQVAGGATADSRRIPANVKPQKILNWAFDGEYWEDEIGSYRSSLRNNCPKSGRAEASVVKKDSETGSN